MDETGSAAPIRPEPSASEFSHFDGKLLCRTLGIRVPEDICRDVDCWTLSPDGIPCQPLSVGELVEYVAGRMLDAETYQSVLSARVFHVEAE